MTDHPESDRPNMAAMTRDEHRDYHAPGRRSPPYPDHPAIRHLQALKTMCDPCSRDAVDVAIDSIRALSELRPKHPKAIVGSRLATMVVALPALVKAQKALGDWDLGKLDEKAALDRLALDREQHNATLDRDDVRAKWGR